MFYEDRIRRFEMSAGKIARSVIAGVGMALNGSDVSKLMEVAVATGRATARTRSASCGTGFLQADLGDGVSRSPGARQSALRAGHTVAVASSATRYQLAALAEDLGVTNVLCSEVELVKGYFTGYVRGPVLWGPAKATAVTEFAADPAVNLKRSFAYANGDEDVPFLQTVGIRVR